MISDLEVIGSWGSEEVAGTFGNESKICILFRLEKM